MLDALLSTLPAIAPMARFGPANLMQLARVAASSGRGYAEAIFRTEAARRVLPGLALHTDVGPDDPCGAVVGFVLGMLASSGGFGVPEGGAGAISHALVRRLEASHGQVWCNERVESIVVKRRRAVAVRTASGNEIEARLGVVADVGAPALFLKLVAREWIPFDVAEAMRAFAYGFGTFKLDWALDGPVPWAIDACRDAAVVHLGDSIDDLARFTKEVRAGELPEHPYLVIGQQSLADPTRAPAGKHTLWAYSRVPSDLAGGWEAARERFADRVDARIEGLAPGFKKRVLARKAFAPIDLERMNAKPRRRRPRRRLGADSASALHAPRDSLTAPSHARRRPLPRLVVRAPRRRRARRVRPQRRARAARGRGAQRAVCLKCTRFRPACFAS